MFIVAGPGLLVESAVALRRPCGGAASGEEGAAAGVLARASEVQRVWGCIGCHYYEYYYFISSVAVA